jgi:hypothetical protein
MTNFGPVDSYEVHYCDAHGERGTLRSECPVCSRPEPAPEPAPRQGPTGNGRDRTKETKSTKEVGRERPGPPADGLLSSDSFLSYDEPPWPELDPAAYHGLVGQVVKLLAPCSEADPAAILATVLAAIGAIAGPTPHARAGHVRHPAKLDVVIVGDTAKARKGTSWATARLVLDKLDLGFVESRVLGGFGSGQSVIDEVADRSDDDGPVDKRLLIHEPEFARVLAVASKETSILSQVIREAWDGGRLQTRARAGKSVATGHHIAMVGHITAAELRRNLTATEIAAGFANRILWVCARRSQRLPFGKDHNAPALARLAREIRDRIGAARKLGNPITFAEDAKEHWSDLYDHLADDDPGGMLGSIIARSDAQTLRLAVLFTWLDGATEIGVDQINAATAVWDYARASAAYIWGDSTGDEIADRLLRAIRDAGGDGLDLTAQSAEFGRNVKAQRLALARTTLERLGLIETVALPSEGGRSRTVSRSKTP